MNGLILPILPSAIATSFSKSQQKKSWKYHPFFCLPGIFAMIFYLQRGKIRVDESMSSPMKMLLRRL